MFGAKDYDEIFPIVFTRTRDSYNEYCSMFNISEVCLENKDGIFTDALVRVYAYKWVLEHQDQIRFKML